MNTNTDNGGEVKPRGRHCRIDDPNKPSVTNSPNLQGTNNPRARHAARTGSAPKHAKPQEAEKLQYPPERETVPVRPSQARLARQRRQGVAEKAAHCVGEIVYGGEADCGNELNSPSDSSQDMEGQAKSKNKMTRGKKTVLGVLATVLIVVLGVGGVLAFWLNGVNSSMGLDDEMQMSDLQDVLTTSEDDVFYMLVLGSDARGNEASRSDVIMLARLDPSEGMVHLISIPRDTMVTIDGYGTQKINAAYAYGGPALAVQVVSEFAGVPISHYAEIHFGELEGLVDLLGGVTVNVPESFYSNAMGIRVNSGEQVLSGAEALAFARERKSVTGGDFGRAQAQRQVAIAIIKEVLATPATELPGVISRAANCVSTSMSLTSIVDLALDFQGQELTLYSDACPSYTSNVNGASYACTMFDEWKTMMQLVDAGLDPDDESQAVPEEQLNNADLGVAPNSPAPRDYHNKAANSLTTENVAEVEVE